MPDFNLAEELSMLDLDHIRQLQRTCYENSKSKGFHDAGDAMRDKISSGRDTRADRRELQNYYGNCLMLIAGELTEAHEELRNGRAINETYYGRQTFTGPQKPEGVPSELADVVIRVFDLAQEAGIDLAGMIAEKLVYNGTRPHMHSREF